MTAVGASAQIPVLCRNCAGPVTPADDLTLVCPYCDTEDQLPADELDRALDLKRRVMVAANGCAQLRGVERALSSLFEGRGAFLRLAAPYMALAIGVLAYSLAGAWPAIAGVPPPFRLGIAIQALLGPLFLAGVALSLAAGLAVGRLSYRRNIRSKLFASPPREPGQPMRCRACGGNLPDGRGPFVTCHFCDTSNLVTAEIQREREALLAREEQFYRQRAAGAVAKVSRTSGRMTRVFVACAVMTYLATIGLALLASSLFPT